MTTVAGTVLDTQSNPTVGMYVGITLIASTSGQGVGWDGSGPAAIVSVSDAKTDAAGVWSAELTPNSEITPANTVYRIKYRGAEPFCILVPDSGTHDVQSLLTVAPTALDVPVSAASTSYTPADGSKWTDPDPATVAAALDDLAAGAAGGGGGTVQTVAGVSPDGSKDVPEASLATALHLSGTNTGDQDLSGLATTAALSSEASTRASADTANANAITAEASTARAAESANASAIGAETLRAEGAEALLAPKASPTFTGTVAGVTKSMVGLGNVDNTSDANKPVSTAQAAADAAVLAASLHPADIGVTVQGYDTALDSIRIAEAGLSVPFGSLDRARAAPHPKFTRLNGALADATSASATVHSQYFTTALVPEMVYFLDGAQGTVTEGALALVGMGSTALYLVRGVYGTAQAHADGCLICTSGVKDEAYLGDSTVQGTVTPGALGFVELVRQGIDARFGGSLGAGFIGIYRDTGIGTANTADPAYGYAAWSTSGAGWSAAPTTATYWNGWYNATSSGSASDIKTLYCGDGEIVQQIDIWRPWYVGFDDHWSYQVSYDNGANWGTLTNGTDGVWTDNPSPSTYPSATTTLNSADNGRALSYWDGTKTMTIMSASGYPSAGYVELTTTSGVVKFRYAGVSGGVLSNVKLVRGSGAWTSATGQTVKLYPMGMRSIITGFIKNPTHLRIRAANSSGTAKSTILSGADLWSTIEIPGTTRGTKIHNWGDDGNLLNTFVNASSFDDCASISGQATITSAKANWSTNYVNATVQHPNFPAGTTVLSRDSATQITVSNNATASGTALGTFTTQIGDFSRFMIGSPASRVLDCLTVLLTNDMALADRTVTGSIAGGVLTVTSGTLYSNDTGKVISGTGITAGSTITFTDSTHAAVAGTTSASSTTITINHLPANVVAIFQNNLTTLYNALNAATDIFLLCPFEQGGTRLDGSQATAAIQLQYRTGIETWAAANGRAVKNIYKQWVAQGIVGYAAAFAAAYMTGGTGFHEDQKGLKDMRAQIERVRQDF